jgi:hypothetical protein
LYRKGSELLPNRGIGEGVLEFAASLAKQKWEIGSVDESKGGAQDPFQGGEGVGG